MKAIELFEKMGYKQIRCDDDYIIYSRNLNEYEGDIETKEISFSSQLENFTVSFEHTLTRQVPTIDVELFLAIEQQLLELGWLKR